MSPEEGRILARERVRARKDRARTIRRRVVAITLSLFLAAWVLMFGRLVTGHDPALGATSHSTKTTQPASSSANATGSQTGSSSSGSTGSSSSGSGSSDSTGSGSSDSSGSSGSSGSSDSTGSSSSGSSSGASAVTTSQS